LAVLDAGAGGGSFARWPAERTGDVLAVDGRRPARREDRRGRAELDDPAMWSTGR
jgi:2-polyprenyl-3-methyl-5-hydroxy-6-metoxy-1,4-benzoquinol methylase